MTSRKRCWYHNHITILSARACSPLPWDQARREQQMHEDDGRKTKGADHEREAIASPPSLPAPRVPRVPLPGEASWASLLPLLDLAPDALLLVDAAGRIALVNRQAEALFGYARSELEGAQLEVLLPARFHAAHVLHRERYAAAPRLRPMGAGLDLYGRRKDGSEVPVDISLSPFTLLETPYMLAAIRDISERRRLQARERAAREAAEARQCLYRAGSRCPPRAGQSCHDHPVGSPLAPWSTNVGLSRRPPHSPVRHRWTAAATGRVRHLACPARGRNGAPAARDHPPRGWDHPTGAGACRRAGPALPGRCASSGGKPPHRP